MIPLISAHFCTSAPFLFLIRLLGTSLACGPPRRPIMFSLCLTTFPFQHLPLTVKSFYFLFQILGRETLISPWLTPCSCCPNTLASCLVTLSPFTPCQEKFSQQFQHLIVMVSQSSYASCPRCYRPGLIHVLPLLRLLQWPPNYSTCFCCCPPSFCPQ